MFIEIHHDPQQYHRSGNKKKTSLINTDYIVAVHTTDFSINTISGNYIHVDANDMIKVIEIIKKGSK